MPSDQRHPEIGRRIREMRQKEGLSQERCAEIVGVSGVTWGRWESGKTEPSASDLIAIQKAFGISLDFLLRPAGCEEIWVLDPAIQERLRALETQSDPFWTTPFSFRLLSNAKVETDRAAMEHWRRETEQYRDSLPR